MDACFISKNTDSYRGEILKQGSFFLRLIVITMNKKKKSQTVHVSIRVEVTKSVRVNAYKRIRKGKVEKVRAHYIIWFAWVRYNMPQLPNTVQILQERVR